MTPELVWRWRVTRSNICVLHLSIVLRIAEQSELPAAVREGSLSGDSLRRWLVEAGARVGERSLCIVRSS